MDLKNINKVKIRDYRDYDPNLCNNGGKYGFTETYYRKEDNTFEIHCFTTAYFDYCEKWGLFQECRNCPNQDYKTGECLEKYTVVTEEELINILKEVESEQDEDYYYVFEKEEN